MRDATVVMARDAKGLVALLSANFPDHGGDYLFLLGGTRRTRLALRARHGYERQRGIR